ncbi:TetR/AcrR family transcriptional regulator [Nocardia stercoris]|uniref:TetR family transcriptional regulator n=1 Tax=Nocardia stercoris TaxID=2483361 RepID=A0A3M2L3C2_9NOCA|nr:TetR/AcrR family transcriptional regulator [Nocardia stercoris]RMI31190.1 TetR family transcriptional regulator [Nocardia stercoris]
MSGRAAPRGRIDKRQAILDAAFTVFARRGYAQTCMQEIAEVAGAAKPTVYNHFADKEALFLAAMAAVSDAVTTRNLAIVNEIRLPVADLDAVLHRTAYRLAQSCCEERSRALRRLVCSEVNHFPDLLETVYGHTAEQLTAALAGKLAQLSLSGQLRPCDPAAAAEQFLALLTAPMDNRSRLGTRKVPTAEIRAVASGAVDTFLRAYATEAPDHTAAA